MFISGFGAGSILCTCLVLFTLLRGAAKTHASAAAQNAAQHKEAMEVFRERNRLIALQINNALTPTHAELA